jgi:hypothetical protein
LPISNWKIWPGFWKIGNEMKSPKLSAGHPLVNCFVVVSGVPGSVETVQCAVHIEIGKVGIDIPSAGLEVLIPQRRKAAASALQNRKPKSPIGRMSEADFGRIRNAVDERDDVGDRVRSDPAGRIPSCRRYR